MEGERDGIMATYAKLIDALKKQYELLLSDLERLFHFSIWFGFVFPDFDRKYGLEMV